MTLRRWVSTIIHFIACLCTMSNNAHKLCVAGGTFLISTACCSPVPLFDFLVSVSHPLLLPSLIHCLLFLFFFFFCSGYALIFFFFQSFLTLPLISCSFNAPRRTQMRENAEKPSISAHPFSVTWQNWRLTDRRVNYGFYSQDVSLS